MNFPMRRWAILPLLAFLTLSCGDPSVDDSSLAPDLCSLLATPGPSVRAAGADAQLALDAARDQRERFEALVDAATMAEERPLAVDLDEIAGFWREVVLELESGHPNAAEILDQGLEGLLPAGERIDEAEDRLCGNAG
jgi:hypothetical protein